MLLEEPSQLQYPLVCHQMQVPQSHHLLYKSSHMLLQVEYLLPLALHHEAAQEKAIAKLRRLNGIRQAIFSVIQETIQGTGWISLHAVLGEPSLLQKRQHQGCRFTEVREIKHVFCCGQDIYIISPWSIQLTAVISILCQIHNIFITFVSAHFLIVFMRLTTRPPTSSTVE